MSAGGAFNVWEVFFVEGFVSAAVADIEGCGGRFGHCCGEVGWVVW